MCKCGEARDFAGLARPWIEIRGSLRFQQEETERVERPVFDLCFNSPDAPDAELVELRIGAEDRDVLTQGLGGDHAVEGVAMFCNQTTGAQGGRRVDGQQGIAGIFHHVEIVPFQLFRPGQLAGAHLGCDLPGGCGGDENYIGLVGYRLPSFAAEGQHF